MAMPPSKPTDDETPKRAEEPDFSEEDEEAMDRVLDRLDAGETLDDVAEIDKVEEDASR